MRRTLLAAATAGVLLLAGCSSDDPAARPSDRASSSATATDPAPSPTPTATPTAATPTGAAPSATPTATPTATPSATPARARQRDVLAISVDGLHVSAIDDVGGLARLLDEGAATLNARTEVEQTVTLPNHASMLTGRRVDADQGGHGVTWNDEIPGRTVPGPDGDGVASVFDVVHDSGGSTALFAGKDKFAIFHRSWPDAIDEVEIGEGADALVDATIEDLTTQRRRFTFLHLALPDAAGHESGWLSEEYLDAVEDTDRLVGELLETIDTTPRLHRRLVVVLTADHGGPEGEKHHDDAGDIANYRIPFAVWGRGVRPADLYELNPDYADPGDEQPSYDGVQPVRNGDLANLATDLLGLGPVPGSELDAEQDLDWR